MSPSSSRHLPSGFTLLEILVVLAILGLIVGLVLTNTDRVFGRSQEAVVRIFVRESLRAPLLRYRMDTGGYPTTGEGLAALLAAPGGRRELWRGPYLDAPGGRLPVDPWGEPYLYRYPGQRNPDGYDLYSKGPDRTAETADDIGNW